MNETVNSTIKVEPSQEPPGEQVRAYLAQAVRSIGAFFARGCVDAWNAVRPEKGASNR